MGFSSSVCSEVEVCQTPIDKRVTLSFSLTHYITNVTSAASCSFVVTEREHAVLIIIINHAHSNNDLSSTAILTAVCQT
jgi:hypothetical protein